MRLFRAAEPVRETAVAYDDHPLCGYIQGASRAWSPVDFEPACVGDVKPHKFLCKKRWGFRDFRNSVCEGRGMGGHEILFLGSRLG
jgi:hypothetical protein